MDKNKEIKNYIDSLFEGYEDSDELKDFKEELQSDFMTKIETFTSKGLSEKEAYEKAKKDLRDVSEMADELSLAKRKDIYSDMYMGNKKYYTSKRIAGYVVFTSILIFGILVSLLTLFFTPGSVDITETSSNENFVMLDHTNLLAMVASLMPFLTAAIGGFVYLGVTQETVYHFPVATRRAVIYCIASIFIVFGLMVAVITGLAMAGSVELGPAVDRAVEGTFTISASAIGEKYEVGLAIGSAIATLIPFFFPGLIALIVLIVTEKDRKKPWFKKEMQKEAEKFSENMRKGNAAYKKKPILLAIQAGIWPLTVLVYLVLGLFGLWHPGWLIFLFTACIQTMLGAYVKAKNKDRE